MFFRVVRCIIVKCEREIYGLNVGRFLIFNFMQWIC